MAGNNNSRRLVVSGRLAFPNLWDPVQYMGSGPFRYEATILIPEESPDKGEVDAAIIRAAESKWGAKAKQQLAGILPNTQKCCWVDGALRSFTGAEGNWCLSAYRRQADGAPKLVDRNKEIDLKQSDGKIYAGAHVRAVVEFYAQDNAHGKGIRCGLIAVQFIKHGDSFGGTAPATLEDLDDVAYADDDDMPF